MDEKSLSGKTCGQMMRPGGYAWARSHKCGKPAKGFLTDGRPACGIHLRAERKREENWRCFEQDIKEQDDYRRQVKTVFDEWGVEYLSIDAKDKSVTLKVETVLCLLGRLATNSVTP